MTQEIKEWQMTVTKASLTFDALHVELAGAGDASGAVTFTKNQDVDGWDVNVDTKSGTKLKELHNTRVLTRHMRAMLRFLYDYLHTPTELTAAAVDEPVVKKRGRVAKHATTPVTVAPLMSAFFANTPIKWDVVLRADTIDTIVAFLE